LIRVGPRMRL